LTAPKNGCPIANRNWRNCRAAVGGYIEVLHIQHSGLARHMVLDEESKLRHYPLNPMATAIAQATGGIARDDYIVGDFVILTGDARLA
jgi:hypothetical protein